MAEILSIGLLLWKSSKAILPEMKSSIPDLYGAFKGQGYGEFYDTGSVTIFADYIVPVVLQQFGVLKYSSTLASMIGSNCEIAPGSEEVELRACSIYAVEKMRDLLSAKSGKQHLNFYSV